MKSPGKRELSSLFLYAAVAIPVFYLPALFYGPQTNFAVIDNWRFWIIHLWVEGYLELFATVLVAIMFHQMGVVTTKTATRLIYLDAILYLSGGIIGNWPSLVFHRSGNAQHGLGGVLLRDGSCALDTPGTLDAWDFIKLKNQQCSVCGREFAATQKWRTSSIVIHRTSDRPDPAGRSLVREDAAARPMVAVVGPTGSGKSDLALHLAEAFQGEVVSRDSLQVYRHFDIGTAKLSADERRRFLHHLIDILEPDALVDGGRVRARGAGCGRRNLGSRPFADCLRRYRLLSAGAGGRAVRRPGAGPGAARPVGRAREAAARFSPSPAAAAGQRSRRRKSIRTTCRKATRALEVCLLTRRCIRDNPRGAEVIRDIVIHRAAGKREHGDTRAAHENVLFADVAAGVGFRERVRADSVPIELEGGAARCLLHATQIRLEKKAIPMMVHVMKKEKVKIRTLTNQRVRHPARHTIRVS